MFLNEENKMKNLNALIEDLKANAKTDWAIQEDMASMSIEDANDATVIRNFIIDLDGANIPTASKYLNNLDTSIREGIVIAVAKDMGNDWVMENLGWDAR